MDIRALAPEDLLAAYDLRIRAFGPADQAQWLRQFRPAVRRGQVLGIYDGDRLVGSGRYHRFEQWWHGRPVPMGGVASVYVAPEERGRGIGRHLARGLLDFMDGLPLTALYPATAPVYRSAGYEHAGAQHFVTVPAEALRTLATGPVKVRRAGRDDVPEIVGVLRRLHAEARDNGPIDRGEDWFLDLLDGDDVFAYLAEDGFLAYGWSADGRDLIVHRCVAGSPETARALWALVGSGSSVARSVHACVAPDDPLFWLLRDRSSEEIKRVSWMLRVLDAPAAVAARGFPDGLSAEIPLAVTDEQRPGNAGAWRLTIGGGHGALTRAEAEPGAVHLSARGLAALYAGVPMIRLRRSGLAEGDASTDALLDAAFGGTPYMLDYF
ncbi:GNAT family N-acetyltransferase [Actinoallomurus sp. NPDC052308]|uniref:GNAT family N-acetyltransferase n=1 Tax=Actinoallomurus sp. NPDC052308 TaxID=3155530 RepID=UPI00342DB8B2